MQGVVTQGTTLGTTAIPPGGTMGGVFNGFAPTTTLATLQGNNTSACPAAGPLPAGCTGTFTGMTDHCGESDTSGGPFNGSCTVPGGHAYPGDPGPPITPASSNVDTNPTVPAAGNVSTVSPLKLLYPGFSGTVTTTIVCHAQLWFGTSSHVSSTGQVSTNAALITRQAQHMIDRGCQVISLDWYGSASYQTSVLANWLTELNGRCSSGSCPLRFFIMEDGGTRSGRNVSGYETDLAYMQGHYWNQDSYWKVTDGAGCVRRPVVIDFGWGDTLSSADYGTLKSYIHSALGLTCNDEPVLGSEGEAGLSDTNRDGAYGWIGVDANSSGNYYDNANAGAVTTLGLCGTGQYNPHLTTTSPCPGNVGTSFLVDSWINVASNHLAQPIAIAPVFAGFNDTGGADWAWTSSTPQGQGRKVSRQCGNVWVKTWGRVTATNKFSSANQIKAVGEIVWDDYEEGTALEAGIDNCYTMNTPSIAGSTISWSLNASSSEASTSTIDHYSIWLLDSAGNAQDVFDASSPTATSATIPGNLPTGTWTMRVQMVGVNGIINRISPAVSYIK